MMRNIYIFRHAKPNIPSGMRLCLGCTDIALGSVGKMQACLTMRKFKEKNFDSVFCSMLERSKQTASFLSESPQIINGLGEASMGIWDGLDFSFIKSHWPELYKARGIDINTPIPNAENPQQVYDRFRRAIMTALDSSIGDIAIVSHASCIQSFLSAVCFGEPSFEYSPKPSYCAYNVLQYDGAFHLLRYEEPEFGALSSDECIALLNAVSVPQKIIDHCVATASIAIKLADELDKNGISLDKHLIKCAALLHDIARTEKEHPVIGASWLEQLGYEKIAEIIRQHHKLDFVELNEAAVVFIADKLCGGSRDVTLQERYDLSRKKCSTPEALDSWKESFDTASELKKLINTTCKAELIR